MTLNAFKKLTLGVALVCLPWQAMAQTEVIIRHLQQNTTSALDLVSQMIKQIDAQQAQGAAAPLAAQQRQQLLEMRRLLSEQQQAIDAQIRMNADEMARQKAVAEQFTSGSFKPFDKKSF